MKTNAGKRITKQPGYQMACIVIQQHITASCRAKMAKLTLADLLSLNSYCLLTTLLLQVKLMTCAECPHLDHISLSAVLLLNKG